MRWGIGLASCALAGCALAPPVTTLHRAGCDTTLATVAAEPVQVKQAANYDVAPQGNCIVGPQGATTTGYLFRLPPFEAGYYVSVASLGDGNSLIPLRLQTLDSNRVVVRTVSPSDIHYRGDGLTGTVFFNTANAAERYLFVSAEPKLIGSKVSRRVLSADTKVIYAGVFILPFTHATEEAIERTFSFGGRFRLQVGEYLP